MNAHRQMSILRPPQKIAGVLLGCALLPVILPAASAAEGTVLTAVYSRVSDDYVRPKFADGTFQPETYAFGRGGHWSGGMRDASIDNMGFTAIARIIAGPLAAQNYLPAKDPKTTRLLIMVYWGTTTGTGDASHSVAYQNLAGSQTPKLNPKVTETGQEISDIALDMALMENRLRDRADLQNARLLGYDSEGLIGTEYGRGLELTALRGRQRDLIDEIEDNRYFVVLMAYDFQMMWKEKKHKLLWETRFSIRQRHHDFDQQLEPMAEFASQYFGLDSHGLIHHPVPEGHVTVGEPKVLSIEPETK